MRWIYNRLKPSRTNNSDKNIQYLLKLHTQWMSKNKGSEKIEDYEERKRIVNLLQARRQNK